MLDADDAETENAWSADAPDYYVALRRKTDGSTISGKMGTTVAPSKSSPDADVHRKLACREGWERPESLCGAIGNPSRGRVGTRVRENVGDRVSSRGQEFDVLGN